MSGENPMLARAGAANDVNGMAVIDSGSMMGGGRAGAAGGQRTAGGEGIPARRADSWVRPAGGSARDCRRSWGSRSARRNFNDDSR